MVSSPPPVLCASSTHSVATEMGTSLLQHVIDTPTNPGFRIYLSVTHMSELVPGSDAMLCVPDVHRAGEGTACHYMHAHHWHTRPAKFTFYAQIIQILVSRFDGTVSGCFN